MKYFILIALISAILSTCNDKKSLARSCDCPENIICTEEYRTISIDIKDASGKPVSLNDYYTTRISTGDKIDLKEKDQDPISRNAGIYPILEDRNMQIVDKCGEEFQFIGVKNGIEIVKETYIIKNNCCHIELTKGKTKISI